MYFFFFKQKTAYEMRISDCSSDVCSSDLTFRMMSWKTGGICLSVFLTREIILLAGSIGKAASSGAISVIKLIIQLGQKVKKATGNPEIGRASCRARVRQSV